MRPGSTFLCSALWFTSLQSLVWPLLFSNFISDTDKFVTDLLPCSVSADVLTGHWPRSTAGTRASGPGHQRVPGVSPSQAVWDNLISHSLRCTHVVAVLIKGHQYGWGIWTLVYGLRTYFVYGLGMTYLGLPPKLINITQTLKNIFDNFFCRTWWTTPYFSSCCPPCFMRWMDK